MRILLQLGLIMSAVVPGFANADEVETRLDVVEKFATQIERFLPHTRENADLSQALRRRVLEMTEAAPSLEIESLMQGLIPRSDTVDAMTRHYADQIVTRLRRTRRVGDMPFETREEAAAHMLADLARAFAFIGNNNGASVSSFEHGLGRANVVLGILFGGGFALSQLDVSAAAQTAGYVAAFVALPFLIALWFPQKIPGVTRFLRWIGGKDPAPDRLVVRAFDRFWKRLEKKIIEDPSFAEFKRFDGPTFFPPKLVEAILNTSGSPARTCALWLGVVESDPT